MGLRVLKALSEISGARLAREPFEAKKKKKGINRGKSLQIIREWQRKKEISLVRKVF